MRFRDKIISLRKKQGYSQENIAEMIGVTRQAVSRWEAGDSTPEMALLVRICKVFNVSADYLINDEYENENDVPAVRTIDASYGAANNIPVATPDTTVTDEYRLRRYKANVWRHLSIIGFYNGVIFSFLAIILFKNPTQRVIWIVILLVLTFVMILQIINYIRNK